MNDFTGFNQDLALNEIDEFAHTMHNIYISYLKCNETFFGEMSHKWASPNAIKFGNEMQPKVVSALLDIVKLDRSYEIKLYDAYNDLCEKNGLTGVSFDIGNELEGRLRSIESNEILSKNVFKDNYFGSTGMNIEDAKVILDNYVNEMININEFLENIPLVVSFYDPGDEMLTAYVDSIIDIKEKVRNTAVELRKRVEEALNTETNNILIAKEHAVETLKG